MRTIGVESNSRVWNATRSLSLLNYEMLIGVRSEILEYGGTPMAPWLLNIESLAAVRVLAQNLLQVSYQDSSGKRKSA